MTDTDNGQVAALTFELMSAYLSKNAVPPPREPRGTDPVYGERITEHCSPYPCRVSFMSSLPREGQY